MTKPTLLKLAALVLLASVACGGEVEGGGGGGKGGGGTGGAGGAAGGGGGGEAGSGGSGGATGGGGAGHGGGGGGTAGGGGAGAGGSGVEGDSSAGTEPFPLGVYSGCSSIIVSGGSSISGPGGSITLSESSGQLLAAFDGTGLATGKIAFNAMTDDFATVAANQVCTVQAVCGGGGGLGGFASATMNIDSGSLTHDGTSLFLSLVGPLGAAGCSESADATFVCMKE